jgi:hypothetical protein
LRQVALGLIDHCAILRIDHLIYLGRGQRGQDVPTASPKTTQLKDWSISRDQSSKWQTIARLSGSG